LPEQEAQQISVCLHVPEQAILIGILLACILQRRWFKRVTQKGTAAAVYAGFKRGAG